MRKTSLFLLITLFSIKSFAASLHKLSNDTVNDGPYIFYANDTLKAKLIENSVLREYSILPGSFPEMQSILNLSCNYSDLINVFVQNKNYSQNFKKVDSIVAISDVHGQFDKYIRLLTANGIIDKDLNWKFGKGHFVFLGDAFDRGDKVTEILWHLFALEKQAIEAGGMVHVLLGNHESMVLEADLRYLNDKYKKVEEIADTAYNYLYSENSVLGKWLRCKPVMISINDILFVHAGISTEMVRMQLTIQQVNTLFSEIIFGHEVPSKSDLLNVDLLNGNDGPLWFRGYYEDKKYNESKLDSALAFYGKKHIVVGHTTFKRMKCLFENRIIGIDTGIGYGLEGEVLLIKNDKLYKGNMQGKRNEL